MNWLLVWWVICPGHSQVLHFEWYQTQAQCEIAGGAVPAHNKAVRWHCSQE